jgi:hypothetical protein
MSIQIVEVESSSLSGISSIDVEYGSNNIAIVEVRQGPAGDDATVTTAAVRAAVPNLVEVATPANDDMIQRIGGSWVTRTIAQVRTALGLGSAAYADTGTGASNVILGNDARLTDARTPTAHASSHVTGGTDKIRDASASQDGLMTTAFAAKLNGIEAGADVTDATNVNAAGAVMESDYAPAHSLLVQQSGTGSPSSLQVGNNTLVGRLSGGGSDIDDLSASQVRTLLNVEDGADVTDAANVASTITGAAAKTTLVDADETVLTDSAASFGLKKVTWANVFTYILTKIQAAASIVFTGQLRSTNQTAATSDALMTRALVDDDALDFTKISLRDDFFGGTDADTQLGQLRWLRGGINGAGTSRPNNFPTSYGVSGITTAAAFRAAQTLWFDSSNVVGISGMDLPSIYNSTFKVTARFQFSSLANRIDIGFTSGGVSAAVPLIRRLTLNYVPAPSDWTASTAITLNDFRKPTVANGRRYYASVGGTTGGTEPTWPTASGGTVVDGTVTWTEYGRVGGSTFHISQWSASASEAAGALVDTGITAAINTWYVLTIDYFSPTVWRFTLNGTPTNITPSTSLAGAMTPTFYIENSSNTEGTLNIDYWAMNTRFTRS